KFALGAMLLLLASVVRADPLLVGNFAGDEGLVDIEINGVLVAEDLDYLDVVTIDQSIGSLDISARLANSGTELASLQIVFRAAPNPMQPMLMLTPTGDQGSPELWLHQDSYLDLDDYQAPTEHQVLISMINVST